MGNNAYCFQRKSFLFINVMTKLILGTMDQFLFYLMQCFETVSNLCIISQKTLPRKISQYNFIRCSLIHPHNTRASTSENYYIKYSRANQLSNSIAIFGAKLWNCLPLGIRRLPFLALQLYMNTE